MPLVFGTLTSLFPRPTISLLYRKNASIGDSFVKIDGFIIKQNIGHLIIGRSRVYFHKEHHLGVGFDTNLVSSRSQQFLSCIEEMFRSEILLSKLMDL